MQNDPDKTKILNVIKIDADIGARNPLANALNRHPVRFNRGDTVRLDISLLENGVPIDVSKISTLNVEIFDIGAPNDPDPRSASLLVQKTIGSSEIESVSTEEMESGKCSAVIILDESDTNIGYGLKWMKISSLSSDAMRSTFAQGWIEIEESYISALEGEHTPPDTYLSRDVAQSLFLSKSENLMDLTDKSAARTNLHVYSDAEVDGLISGHEHSEYLSASEAQGIYSTKEELASSIGSTSAEISGLGSKISALEKDENRTKEIFEESAFVRMKNGTISVKIAGMDSVPLSFCFSYKRDIDWVTGDYFFDKSIASGMNTNGFNVVCDNYGRYIRFMFRTNTNAGYATTLSFKKEKFPCDGKWHSVVMTASDRYTSSMKCFVDGEELEKDENMTYEGVFDGNISTDAPLKVNYYTKGDMCMCALKIFNFDISREGSPYTPEDYFNHKRIPVELLKSTDGEKAILSLGGDLNDVQWKDDSANATHAILEEETYASKSNYAYTVRESAIWEVSSTSGIFLVKDQAWIPSDCRFCICAKSTSEAQFNLGDDSSATFFSQNKTISTGWAEIGSYWNADQNKRIRLTPVSAFQGTVEFFVEIKKLK